MASEENRPLRMTTQRQLIMEELKATRSHPTADEIYETVRKRLPSISLGTVYRNLEILSEHGLIKKLETAGTQRRYDAITQQHSHIQCLGCGRIDDMEEGPAFDPMEEVSAPEGYKLLDCEVHYFGLCRDCRKKRL